MGFLSRSGLRKLQKFAKNAKGRLYDRLAGLQGLDSGAKGIGRFAPNRKTVNDCLNPLSLGNYNPVPIALGVMGSYWECCLRRSDRFI